jgi:hypothetical protein
VKKDWSRYRRPSWWIGRGHKGGKVSTTRIHCNAQKKQDLVEKKNSRGSSKDNRPTRRGRHAPAHVRCRKETHQWEKGVQSPSNWFQRSEDRGRRNHQEKDIPDREESSTTQKFEEEQSIVPGRHIPRKFPDHHKSLLGKMHQCGGFARWSWPWIDKSCWLIFAINYSELFQSVTMRSEYRDRSINNLLSLIISLTTVLQCWLKAQCERIEKMKQSFPGEFWLTIVSSQKSIDLTPSLETKLDQVTI